MNTFLRLFRYVFAVAVRAHRPFKGQMLEVVRFQLDTDHLLITAETQIIIRYFTIGIRLIKFVHQVFGRIFFAIRLFRTKRRINFEERHQCR